MSSTTQARKTSGLSADDISDAKIFIRSFNDALDCTRDIAYREAGRNHYKEYVRVLISAMRSDKLMLDKNGEIVASQDKSAANIYRLMKFSEEVSKRYSLSSEVVTSKQDLEGRLDRAITGLETEIALKQADCNRLLDDCRRSESMATKL